MTQSLSTTTICVIRADDQRNRLAVFEALMDLQPATKYELAEATTLCVSSIQRHLSALIDAGEVYRIEGAHGPGLAQPDRFRVELTDAARRAAAAQARMLRSPVGGAAA